MKPENKKFINILAFVSLILVAFFIFLDNLLGITIDGDGWVVILLNALRTLSNILTLVIIGIAAYKFAENNRKWIKIVYWVAVAIFVAATVLIWL